VLAAVTPTGRVAEPTDEGGHGSEHASPLAVLGGVDAGGQNVHVACLAAALGRLGADVVVHTRRDDPSLPRRATFAPRVVVDHVTAGPPAKVPKDDLLPHMVPSRPTCASSAGRAAEWCTATSGCRAGGAGGERRLDVPVRAHVSTRSARSSAPPGRS